MFFDYENNIAPVIAGLEQNLITQGIRDISGAETSYNTQYFIFDDSQPQLVLGTQAQTVSLPAKNNSAVGIDIHRDFFVAEFQSTLPEMRDKFKSSSSAKGIEKMTEWIMSHNPDIVVMESTGIYWQKLYYSLIEQNINTIVINASSIKSPIGKKTDETDAARLAVHGRIGDLIPSLVPSVAVRNLRIFTREAFKAKQHGAKCRNQIQKLLKTDGCGLCKIVSDINGKTAKAIQNAFIDNPNMDEDALKALAKEASKKLKASEEEILEELQGSKDALVWTAIKQKQEELAFTEANYKFYMHQAQEIVQKDEKLLSVKNLLMSIPCIKEHSALIITAEFAANIDSFPKASYLASWTGLCPGTAISAGKNYKTGTGHGNKYVRQILIEVANVAKRAVKEAPELVLWYNKMNGRIKNAKKATVALAHKILRIIFGVVSHQSAYDAKHAEKTAQEALKRLREMHLKESVSGAMNLVIDAQKANNPVPPEQLSDVLVTLAYSASYAYAQTPEEQSYLKTNIPHIVSHITSEFYQNLKRYGYRYEDYGFKPSFDIFSRQNIARATQQIKASGYLGAAMLEPVPF